MSGGDPPVPPAVTEQTATLLWEACRRDPAPAAVGRALASGADLALALRAAAEHRIGPMLWRALGAADARDALGPERALLGGVADAFRMEAVLLIPRAVALAVRPLTDAGLEPVVFKGPALAARYPEPGLRPMEDIDLLLPRADHSAPSERWRAPDGPWRARPAATATTPHCVTPTCRRCSSSCTTGSKAPPSG